MFSFRKGGFLFFIFLIFNGIEAQENKNYKWISLWVTAPETSKRNNYFKKVGAQSNITWSSFITQVKICKRIPTLVSLLIEWEKLTYHPVLIILQIAFTMLHHDAHPSLSLNKQLATAWESTWTPTMPNPKMDFQLVR